MKYPGDDQPFDWEIEEQEQDPRDKDDDDGVEYADPRDEMDDRMIQDIQ